MNRTEPQQGDDAMDAEADALLGALPVVPIDRAFSRRVLGSAHEELAASRSSWKRTERFIARVLVPITLLVCAAGLGYRFVHVAQEIYVSHAD